MTKIIKHPPDVPTSDNCTHPERRVNTSDQRKGKDRRSQNERRLDSRLAAAPQPKSLRTWLRSKIYSRLGVDRRKKEDRRNISDRRQKSIRSILTQDEINDLLAP
ncbi:MAG: hypothetical protein P4L42_08365 [Desulfocapsaceae bacterium]|nr:hypothetical protein [Desulfocapsaceae bacterium]